MSAPGFLIFVLLASFTLESTAIKIRTTCRKARYNSNLRQTYYVQSYCYKVQPQNGNWSPWGQWMDTDTCDRSCDTGNKNQIRTRACTNPSPSDGGLPCEEAPGSSSSETRKQPCNTHACQDGAPWLEWSFWENVSPCKPSCGTNRVKAQQKSRQCSDPSNGGAACKGDQIEFRMALCVPLPCKVHGGWSDWTPWKIMTLCSKTCGGGTRNQNRTRECNNPAPDHGGNDCIGDTIEKKTFACSTNSCPIHGGWSGWSVWKDKAACSKECGGGTKDQVRTRTCTNPAPAHNGTGCGTQSSESKTIACNTALCIIDGGWSPWNQWRDQTECTASCDGGSKTQERHRVCDNPRPENNGKPCPEKSMESRTKECGMLSCKLFEGWGNWTAWKDIDECSVLCGGGEQFQERTRVCERSNNGLGCQGPKVENQTIPCGEKPCGQLCSSANTYYFKHETNSSRYYVCTNNIAFLMNCPEGQVFVDNSTICTPEASHNDANQPCDITNSELLPVKGNVYQFKQCGAEGYVIHDCHTGTVFNVKKQYCDWENNQGVY